MNPTKRPYQPCPPHLCIECLTLKLSSWHPFPINLVRLSLQKSKIEIVLRVKNSKVISCHLETVAKFAHMKLRWCHPLRTANTRYPVPERLPNRAKGMHFSKSPLCSPWAHISDRTHSMCCPCRFRLRTLEGHWVIAMVANVFTLQVKSWSREVKTLVVKLTAWACCWTGGSWSASQTFGQEI